MTIEQGIDEFIEAGWRALSSDFDDGALKDWKRKAVFWMDVLLDPGPCDATDRRGPQHDSSWENAHAVGKVEHSAGRKGVPTIAL